MSKIYLEAEHLLKTIEEFFITHLSHASYGDVTNMKEQLSDSILRQAEPEALPEAISTPIAAVMRVAEGMLSTPVAIDPNTGILNYVPPAVENTLV